MRTPLSWPIYIPKTLPPNTTPLGIRILTYKFLGDANIQSIAVGHKDFAFVWIERVIHVKGIALEMIHSKRLIEFSYSY